MPRQLQIDLTDYECLQKYIASHPERRAEFEDTVLDLRRRGTKTIVIDDADGEEVYELVPLN